MASTAAPSFSLLLPSHKRGTKAHTKRRSTCLQAVASDGGVGGRPPEGAGEKKGTPGVDTRIHWENPDEGWLGVKKSSSGRSEKEVEEERDDLEEKFAHLLNNSADSHYQFLGVSAEADMEEIKAAYRRLSKEYHPDTTSLPLKMASDKFMQLREVYNILSNKESRKFYDWSLAQEVASREAERMKMKFEDPYEQELKNWESIPDTVDRLGGKNMDLCDQAMAALTIDAAILVFTICCIIYVLFFKEPY